MAYITWDDVTYHATELTTVDSNAQNNILNYVNDVFKVGDFGGEESYSLKQARIYLAAHMATMDAKGNSGASGPVTSESAGGLSISYGSSSGGDGTWSDTAYGRMLQMLLRTARSRVPFAI